VTATIWHFVLGDLDDKGHLKTALRDEAAPRRIRQFGSARDGLRE
jgi:hypothetical protein